MIEIIKSIVVLVFLNWRASAPLRSIESAAGTVVISKEPMGEAVWLPEGTHTAVIVKTIRFVTPEVAMVDAFEKGPVLILMKKVGPDWKIASLRRLSEK